MRGIRAGAIAIGITFASIASTPASADTCATTTERSAIESEGAIDPPESTGCAVRPGVGALASLGMSILALGLAARRRSNAR